MPLAAEAINNPRPDLSRPLGSADSEQASGANNGSGGGGRGGPGNGGAVPTPAPTTAAVAAVTPSTTPTTTTVPATREHSLSVPASDPSRRQMPALHWARMQPTQSKPGPTAPRDRFPPTPAPHSGNEAQTGVGLAAAIPPPAPRSRTQAQRATASERAKNAHAAEKERARLHASNLATQKQLHMFSSDEEDAATTPLGEVAPRSEAPASPAPVAPSAPPPATHGPKRPRAPRRGSKRSAGSAAEPDVLPPAPPDTLDRMVRDGEVRPRPIPSPQYTGDARPRARISAFRKYAGNAANGQLPVAAATTTDGKPVSRDRLPRGLASQRQRADVPHATPATTPVTTSATTPATSATVGGTAAAAAAARAQMPGAQQPAPTQVSRSARRRARYNRIQTLARRARAAGIADRKQAAAAQAADAPPRKGGGYKPDPSTIPTFTLMPDASFTMEHVQYDKLSFGTCVLGLTNSASRAFDSLEALLRSPHVAMNVVELQKLKSGARGKALHFGMNAPGRLRVSHSTV